MVPPGSFRVTAHVCPVCTNPTRGNQHPFVVVVFTFKNRSDLSIEYLHMSVLRSLTLDAGRFLWSQATYFPRKRTENGILLK